MRRQMRRVAGERPEDGPAEGVHPESHGNVPRGNRRSVEIRGFAKLQDGSRVPVVLVNLSYDGCAMETPVPLEPGTPLHLSTRVGELDAEVRWCSGTEAGLHFKVQSSEDQEAAQAQRESVRIPVTIGARMKRFGRGGYEVPVSDVSGTGCKVEFADRPDVGETVSIKFEGLDSLEATVRWVAGRNCGLDFVYPIHPAILDMLLHRSSGAA